MLYSEMLLYFLVSLCLIGCGPERKESSPEETQNAVRKALSGSDVNEEEIKNWKRISQMGSKRFMEFSGSLVTEMCLTRPDEYHKCQRNTWVMKDVEWSTVKRDEPTHWKAFVEGIRVFLANPRRPIPDDIEALRVKLRETDSAFTTTEQSISIMKREVKQLKKVLVELVDTELVLNAIKGGTDEIRVIKLIEESTSVKELILKLIKDLTNGYNVIKAVSGYTTLLPASFTDLGDSQKAEKARDDIYQELIK